MTRTVPREGGTASATSAADTEHGWFVYAVVDAGRDLPADLAGLDGEPVETVPSGRVAAVVSRFALDRPPGRAAELMAFHELVDRLSADLEAVVPVRFGSVVPERDSIVDDFLGPDEGWFGELLDDVRGRAQFLVQALYDEETVLREIVVAEPEVAMLSAMTRDLPEEAAYGERVRLGELVSSAVEHRRTEDSAQLLDDILPLVDAHVLRPVSGLERVLDVALLVDVARVDELETRLEVLAEEVHGRMRLRLMGPTAAYDFAGGSRWDS